LFSNLVNENLYSPSPVDTNLKKKKKGKKYTIYDNEIYRRKVRTCLTWLSVSQQ